MPIFHTLGKTLMPEKASQKFGVRINMFSVGHKPVYEIHPRCLNQNQSCLFLSDHLTIDCVSNSSSFFYKKTFSKKTQIQSEQTSSAVLFCTVPIFYVQQLDLLLSYPKPDKELIVWKIDNCSFLLKAIYEFL